MTSNERPSGERPAGQRSLGDLLSAGGQPPWQPQADPQPPPDDTGAGPPDVAAAPVEANTESSRMAPSWPSGHEAGAFASDIGRRISKVDSQVRQRYS